MVKIDIHPERYGGYTVTFTSKKLNKELKKKLNLKRYPTGYIQSDDNLPEISNYAKAQLDNGYTATVIMDFWIACHYFQDIDPDQAVSC